MRKLQVFYVLTSAYIFNVNNHSLLIAEDPLPQRNKWRDFLKDGCHGNTQHKLNTKQCLKITKKALCRERNNEYSQNTN